MRALDCFLRFLSDPVLLADRRFEWGGTAGHLVATKAAVLVRDRSVRSGGLHPRPASDLSACRGSAVPARVSWTGSTASSPGGCWHRSHTRRESPNLTSARGLAAPFSSKLKTPPLSATNERPALRA